MSRQTQPRGLMALPSEVLVMVLARLPLRDLAKVSQVSEITGVDIITMSIWLCVLSTKFSTYHSVISNLIASSPYTDTVSSTCTLSRCVVDCTS